MIQKSYGDDCSKVARDLRVLERRHNTTRKMLRESSDEFDRRSREFDRRSREFDRRSREFDQRMAMLQEVVFGHAKQTVPPAHTAEL